MAPLTKRSRQLLKVRPVKQNQTLIEPLIDFNISPTFSDKAIKIKQELINKIKPFAQVLSKQDFDDLREELLGKVVHIVFLNQEKIIWLNLF